jgi:predicted NBD/HSP70 family sugar kinase
MQFGSGHRYGSFFYLLITAALGGGLVVDGGYRMASPHRLVRLGGGGRAIVGRWIQESTEALVKSMVAINCLINPEAILIGGRLPAILVDQLAAALNARMADFASRVPAIAPVARAVTADDAPAVGAAILPFTHSLLPTRFALLKGE